jgi:hypothetical protein
MLGRQTAEMMMIRRPGSDEDVGRPEGEARSELSNWANWDFTSGFLVAADRTGGLKQEIGGAGQDSEGEIPGREPRKRAQEGEHGGKRKLAG